MTTFASKDLLDKGGSHEQFVNRYEDYLDAVQRCRQTLVDTITARFAEHDVKTVLDCAAGTGFPALDLAAVRPEQELRVHCTDGDVEMLRVLKDRLADFAGVGLRRITPPRTLALGAASALLLGWHELGQIRRTYDYVMCRGNSLTYANSWRGGRGVSSRNAVQEYIRLMAERVRPGGHLHLDAPWRLELADNTYPAKSPGAPTISECVSTEPDCRRWEVKFRQPGGPSLSFTRYSTRLTIYEVKGMLDKLGFEDTDPFALYGERLGFGVIIARKRY